MGIERMVTTPTVQEGRKFGCDVLGERLICRQIPEGRADRGSGAGGWQVLGGFGDGGKIGGCGAKLTPSLI